MKEWLVRFVLHAFWSRRKGFYYVLSVISIAGNLIVLVGPSLQASIGSCSRALHPALASATAALLQTLVHAASASLASLRAALSTTSTVDALQARVWTALPHLADSVLRRSVLCVLLNVIVVRFLVKAGLLAGGSPLPAPHPTTPAISTTVRPEEARPSSNFHNLSGSHWLAPSYLQTVCNTLLNMPDYVSTGPSMLLQHARDHGHCSPAVIEATSSPKRVQRRPSMLFVHNDLQLQDIPATELSMVAAAPFPPPCPAATTAAPPSLFTIEPLDELLQSMASHHAPNPDAQVAQMSRHPLRKVATKVDLLQAVRARRRESRLNVEPAQQPINESGRSVQGVEDDQHRARRKEQHGRGKVRGSHAQQNGGGLEGDNGVGGDDEDSKLSSQEFNKRVDTFISKFKRNLTMQRQDSLNRLLGLY